MEISVHGGRWKRTVLEKLCMDAGVALQWCMEVCGWRYGRGHSCGVTNNQEYAQVREELPGVAAYVVCCGSMPLALVDQNVL